MLTSVSQAIYDKQACESLKGSVADSGFSIAEVARAANENPFTLWNHLNYRTPVAARDIRTVFIGTGRRDFRPLELICGWLDRFPIPLDNHFLRKAGGARRIRREGMALLNLADKIEGHEAELRGHVLREALTILGDAVRELISEREELRRGA
jgi:hypothetical protein